MHQGLLLLLASLCGTGKSAVETFLVFLRGTSCDGHGHYLTVDFTVAASATIRHIGYTTLINCAQAGGQAHGEVT